MNYTDYQQELLKRGGGPTPSPGPVSQGWNASTSSVFPTPPNASNSYSPYTPNPDINPMNPGNDNGGNPVDYNDPYLQGPVAGAPPVAPISTPSAPTTSSSWAAGGGWGNATGTAVGLKKAFDMGLKGQAAVDWTNANGYPGIAYYADRGMYGLPDGFYVAPNNNAGGALDLIQRSSGGESGGGGGGAQVTVPGGAGAWNDGRGDALYNLLMQRAGQSLEINPNDPVIKSQTDAYGATQQRAERDYLSKAAEGGGPINNLNAEARSGAEHVGQSTSGFQATLMGQELSAKRQEIVSALQGAQGLLTSQQQMKLQEQLHMMDLALNAQQFNASQGQQQNQFYANLGQNAYQFDVNDRYRNSPLGSA